MVNPLAARSEENEETLSQNIEEIYKRHVITVYRVCYSYMKNAADSEDIVSDVFAKLLKTGTDFQSAEHEKAWLLRTASNMCKNQLKHWWHKRESIENYENNENLQSKNQFHEDEILNIVMELPERYKDVIYLYYYEGYTTEEVAGILKKPHSTVRSLLRNARKILKGVLEDEE